MRFQRPRSTAKRQSGQVMVLVAVSLMALIGSAALILLAGSVEWQKNQLQELADSAALDSALSIGSSCDTAKATAVITRVNTFLAARRTGAGALAIVNGTCATPYTGTNTFAGGLSATIHYPYRAHQQQLEVILTLALPISFGAQVGSTSTTVVRRAVAQQLAASTAAITATNLTCAGGQVNVAGSVVAQNLIVRTGTCALYAHARFDAASSTYTDTGNVRVYADSQPWTAPGTCVAGANSGSSSAICADGFELTGHAGPSCGGLATSYLTAGVKAVDPDPCAAGTGPQPAAASVNTLSPEPNLDASAIATLTGTGGAACTAGAVLPNIVVAGTTVATGNAAVPIKDASGYYHFKPSCYGYLNPGSLSGGGGGIANVLTGPVDGPSVKDVFPSLPVASTAGNLLVVTISSDTNPSNKPFTAPAGWVSALAGGAFLDGTAHTEIWYYPNNPGGILNADFSISPASIDAVAQMTEWSGVAAAAPLDRTGISLVSTAGKNQTVSTSAATTVANELVVTGIGFRPGAAGNAYTPGVGWSNLSADTADGFSSDYRSNLPAAVASETVTYSVNATWSSMIASFKPAAGGGGGGAGAVLDPGFYYFNGSGFAGGGGICLNGGTLLARDVTLEFVNAAGFSSGTCAAGGGASCVAPCAFGSDPANAAADSPNNLTWFASPCTFAPAAGNGSCPASAWCPAGDRSCTNQLIWAAAAGTGQINLNGAANKAWLLGTVSWPGTCNIQVNGSGTIAGNVACGTLSIAAAAGAGTAVGSDSGISTALVEAVLIE